MLYVSGVCDFLCCLFQGLVIYKCCMFQGFVFFLCCLFQGFMIYKCYMFQGFVIFLCWMFQGFMIYKCCMFQGFVIFVTMCREALDDYRRYRRDKEANSQKFRKLTRDGMVPVPSSNIKVGDLIVVDKVRSSIIHSLTSMQESLYSLPVNINCERSYLFWE